MLHRTTNSTPRTTTPTSTTSTTRRTRTTQTLIATTLVAAFMAGGVPAYAAITSGTDSGSATVAVETDRASLAPVNAVLAADTNSIASIKQRAALPAGHIDSTASLITDTPAVLAIKKAAEARAAKAEQKAEAKALAIKRAAAAKKAAAAAAKAAAAAAAAAPKQAAAVAPVFAGNTSAAAAQQIARTMIASRYNWGYDQFVCLVNLWNKESGWNVNAYNASSGAGGIPQALPASKMATAGADWQTNPATQISWGLGYIKSRYGTACVAWNHAQTTGWY